MKISNVVITGGTHGNEYTGIYLLRKMQQTSFSRRWGDLKVELLHANPEAYALNKRFVDADLNRCFTQKILSDDTLTSYEAERAQEINQLIGPKESSATDMIIDMHTTTASMGVTLILVNDDSFNFRMAAYVQSKLENCYVYHVPALNYAGNLDHPFLNSLAPYGFLLEVGPIANSLVRHDVLEQTYAAICAALEFVTLTNANQPPAIDEQLEVYQHAHTVNFPTDAEGHIAGYIHKDLQDRDYQLLKKGTAIFEMLNGDVIHFEEEGCYYPVFINEAAYYYQKIAFSLTEKVTIDLA